jgi:quinol monooxygenase YgiN
MTTSIIAAKDKRVTGINVFTLPRERHGELIDTLRAMNTEIIAQGLPMIVSANFHRAITGRVMLNYNQYTDRENIHILRSIPGAAELRKRTHDLSDAHEIRWYAVAEVVTPDPGADALEISADGKAVTAIGIFTAKAGKQEDLLSLLRCYGETLNDVKAPGFLGIATHRGDDAAHVATYEKWQSAASYAAAAGLASVKAVTDRFPKFADPVDRQLYEVVEVARFDLERVARAARG